MSIYDYEFLAGEALEEIEIYDKKIADAFNVVDKNSKELNFFEPVLNIADLTSLAKSGDPVRVLEILNSLPTAKAIDFFKNLDHDKIFPAINSGFFKDYVIEDMISVFEVALDKVGQYSNASFSEDTPTFQVVGKSLAAENLKSILNKLNSHVERDRLKYANLHARAENAIFKLLNSSPHVAFKMLPSVLKFSSDTRELSTVNFLKLFLAEAFRKPPSTAREACFDYDIFTLNALSLEAPLPKRFRRAFKDDIIQLALITEAAGQTVERTGKTILDVGSVVDPSFKIFKNCPSKLLSTAREALSESEISLEQIPSLLSKVGRGSFNLILNKFNPDDYCTSDLTQFFENAFDPYSSLNSLGANRKELMLTCYSSKVLCSENSVEIVKTCPDVLAFADNVIFHENFTYDWFRVLDVKYVADYLGTVKGLAFWLLNSAPADALKALLPNFSGTIGELIDVCNALSESEAEEVRGLTCTSI